MHDLGRLLDVLPEPRPDVTSADLLRLNPWVVQGRYDLDTSALDRASAAALVAIASQTVGATADLLATWPADTADIREEGAGT